MKDESKPTKEPLRATAESHGIFIMRGNYCEARLNDWSNSDTLKEAEKWCKAINAFELSQLAPSEEVVKEDFQNALDGPYVDFNKPNIFIDGDFNDSYSLMTSSVPENRERGAKIRISELLTRNNGLKQKVSDLEALVKELTAEIDRLNKTIHE